MKKIIFILLLGFFGAQQIWAQARIFNSTNEKLVVSDLKGLTEVVINPKSSAIATFLPSDGVAKFNLARYEGFNKVNLGEATRLSRKGRIALENLSLNDGSVSAMDGAKTESQVETVRQFGYAGTSTGSTRSAIQDRPGVVPESGLVLSNQSSYRMVVRDGIFTGTALASKQISRNPKRVSTGTLTFSVYFDPEEDSISSGRNHRLAVINKIIVEGQDSLHITDSDLAQVSGGKEVQKVVKNKFKIDFQIVSGQNIGEMISARGGKMARLKFQVGLNQIAVEYLTEKGLPVRAILSLMVNDSRKAIKIDRRTGTDLDSVDPSQIVFSNSDSK